MTQTAELELSGPVTVSDIERWAGSAVGAVVLIAVFMLLAIRPYLKTQPVLIPFIELGVTELPAEKNSLPPAPVIKKNIVKEQSPPQEQSPVSPVSDNLFPSEADIPAPPKQTEPPSSSSSAPVQSEIRFEPGVRLDNVDFSPVFNPRPVYPQVAITARLGGYVDADLFINENGRVERFSIVSVDGHPAFGIETAKVLPRWRFPPPRKNGKAIKVKYLYRIWFKLE